MIPLILPSTFYILHSQVTERDIKLILDVYKHRYLSTSQIVQLHFPSRQTANRRLRALLEEGYLKGYKAPSIDDRIFHLTPKGAEIVASTLGVPPDALHFRRIADAAKDYYFLKHFLALNEFRIALTLGLKATDALNLLGFIPEYYGEKTDKGGVVKYIRDFVCDIKDPEQRINFTPDGVFALEKDGNAALFFLEIDRGTEILSNPDKGVLKAVYFYYNYFISGKYQRYTEDFKCQPFRGFRVLFVTTTETRLSNMQAAVSRERFKETRFVWLTTADKIQPETILTNIWQSLDPSDANRYRIG